jgi:hypothetical protein
MRLAASSVPVAVKHRAVEPVNIFKKTLCIYVVIKFAV